MEKRKYPMFVATDEINVVIGAWIDNETAEQANAIAQWVRDGLIVRYMYISGVTIGKTLPEEE